MGNDEAALKVKKVKKKKKKKKSKVKDDLEAAESLSRPSGSKIFSISIKFSRHA